LKSKKQKTKKMTTISLNTLNTPTGVGVGSASSLNDLGSQKVESATDELKVIVEMIMRKVVPSFISIDEDSLQMVTNCSLEFMSSLTSEALTTSTLKSRPFVKGEDLIESIRSLGYEDYVNSITVYSDKLNSHLTLCGQCQPNNVKTPKEKKSNKRAFAETATTSSATQSSSSKNINIKGATDANNGTEDGGGGGGGGGGEKKISYYKRKKLEQAAAAAAAAVAAAGLAASIGSSDLAAVIQSIGTNNKDNNNNPPVEKPKRGGKRTPKNSSFSFSEPINSNSATVTTTGNNNNNNPTSSSVMNDQSSQSQPQQLQQPAKKKPGSSSRKDQKAKSNWLDPSYVEEFQKKMNEALLEANPTTFLKTLSKQMGLPSRMVTDHFDEYVKISTNLFFK
jgi:nuclear transcription Y subunit beta